MKKLVPYVYAALILIPASAGAFTLEFYRIPPGNIFEKSQDVSFILNTENIADIKQSGSDCTTTSTTHLSYRFSGGENPVFIGNITEPHSTTTISLPTGGYDSVALMGRDDLGNICYLATLEEFPPSQRFFVFIPQCADGIDNDGDGTTDMDDSGCVNEHDNNENRPPRITLRGAPNINAEHGRPFQDPGAIVEDDEDNPPPALVTDGSVTTDTTGDYTITYSATDSAGESAEVQTRTVRVRTQCSDDIDNDGDGKIDVGKDPGCDNANDDDESNPPPANGPPGGGGGGGSGAGAGAVLGAFIGPESTGQVLSAVLTRDEQIALIKAEIEELKKKLMDAIRTRITELEARLALLLSGSQ